jgi:hypothetical protein
MCKLSPVRMAKSERSFFYALAIYLLIVHIAVVLPAAPSMAQGKSPELEKVLALVREKLEIQKRLQADLAALEEKYPGMDVDPIYRSADLVSTAGLANARAQLGQYSALTSEWLSIQDRLWSDWASSLREADLPEPYGARVRMRFAEAEPAILRNHISWESADKELASSIKAVLDFAERNAKNLRLHDGELSFTEASAEREYGKLQRLVADAEQRSGIARRLALEMDDGTTEILRSAILEYR